MFTELLNSSRFRFWSVQMDSITFCCFTKMFPISAVTTLTIVVMSSLKRSENRFLRGTAFLSSWDTCWLMLFTWSEYIWTMRSRKKTSNNILHLEFQKQTKLACSATCTYLNILQEVQKRTRRICRRSLCRLQCWPPSEEPAPHGTTTKTDAYLETHPLLKWQTATVMKWQVKESPFCLWDVCLLWSSVKCWRHL